MQKIELRSGIKFIESILGRIGIRYVNTVVFEKHIGSEMPMVRTKTPVNIKLASKDDINNFYTHKKKSEAIDRFEKGDLCFIAKINGRFIGHFWVSINKEIYIPEIERNISFGHSFAYQYDGWVDPQFRNLGIGKKAMENMLQYLKSKNIKKLYTISRYAPAQKALHSLEFHPVKVLRYIRIFMFKKYKETNLR